MRHILLLTDRDWTHPQGGGTGANLFGQVAFWLEWGYRVTVVAGTYEGAEPVSRPAPGLELHHMGSRVTVFPRAAWAVRRGLAADADVVLEVVNGITFLTPLWCRTPRVTLVHHIHREHYVTELGRKGAVAALFAETLPLKLLYGGAPFLTISESAKNDIVELGVAPDDIHVGYLGVVPFPPVAATRSETPRLLYLGRLKRYKRIELLLDVLEGNPGSVLDIAGDGDHRPALEAGDRGPRPQRARRPARARLRGGEGVAVHARLGQPHRVLGRGLVPDRDGGRDVWHAERGAPHRRAARVDRRRLDRAAGRRRAGADRRRAAPAGRRRPAGAHGLGRTRARGDVHVGAHGARVGGPADRDLGRGRRCACAR